MGSMRLLLFISLFVSNFVFARELPDTGFLSTQTTSSNPYTVPAYVNENGVISILNNGFNIISFQPILQTSLGGQIIKYVQPVKFDKMIISPIKQNLGWIEEKRIRTEYGIGINMLIKSRFSLGIIPFKGALNTITSQRDDKGSDTLSFWMPKNFHELKNWKINDHGVYQTYGGVTALANFGLGVINIGNFGFSLQNQFIVSIKKNSDEEVVLKISEGDLKRRQLILGPLISTATIASFKGNRFSVEFILSLNEEDHFEFFTKALDGDLAYIQERLPFNRQRFSWEGNERHYYVGIPMVAGKLTKRGEYSLIDDENESELDFKSSRNTGMLTPIRNHRDLVIQTREEMTLIWSSEMTKTKKEIFKQRYLIPGKILGLAGFETVVPEDIQLGTTITHIALQLKKDEIFSVNTKLNEFKINFLRKCLSLIHI